MRTFIADIIPKLESYSQKLDNLTLLIDQHWVVVDEISDSKTVYIFRANNELLISQNGKVEKARWEYLGNNSLLIDKKEGSFLFKHGFIDENILALKVDNKEEFAIFFNENKLGRSFTSISKLIDFLKIEYLVPGPLNSLNKTSGTYFKGKIFELPPSTQRTYIIRQGELTLIGEYISRNKKIIKALLNGEIAPNGKYKLGFFKYAIVKDGLVIGTTTL